MLKDGKWIVRARIPRDENEVFAEPEHVRELPITVIAKKLRVLLIADAPSREFQFLRSFLNREVLENRATLTLLVQNEAGTTGNLTPNPTEKVIQRFPTRLDLSGKISDPVEKLYNLNEYDVIVAFDPNWKEVSKEQTEAIRTWVERQGGGFIFIPDRINTDALAVASFPSAPPDIRERLTPILDILPVIPEDSRTIAAALPPPRTPRRLYLHPTPESDLLRIDEPPPAAVDPTKKEAPMGPKRNEDPVAGWERFFTDRDKYIENKDDKIELFPKRGFFSCYPVKDVKPTAAVLAEFVYDDFNRQKAVRPWLVVSNPSAAQSTCFLASGEIYRMRAYDQRYPEQFWDKMLTFMAEKRNVKSSRGHLQVSREVISGRPIRVQAQILDASSRPYPPNAISPKFTVFQVTPDGTRTLISKAPIEMKEGVEGYYTGQVRADPNLYPPGDSDYFVVVDVPDSPGDTLQGKFKVLKSDLEMNDTTPDFAAHLRLASEFNSSLQVPEPVRVRFNDPVVGLPRENGVPKLAFKSTDRELIKLIPECFRTVRTSGDVRGPVDDLWDEQVALYDFKLAEDPRTIEPGSRVEFMHKRLGLEWHPESNPRPATSFRDFLHKGPKVFRKPDPGYTPTGDNGGNPEGVRGRWPAEQIAVNWAVLVVVFLLCWEWLTRKLLRLA
ncbi:MAG TPA: hypothetical protein VLM40_20435 [Gemmata sp.]|nr:hypothetical protein [Gemmata sp.]